jgi:hypothetical protein
MIIQLSLGVASTAWQITINESVSTLNDFSKYYRTGAYGSAAVCLLKLLSLLTAF